MSTHGVRLPADALLEGAQAAARWICSTAHATDHGLVWLPDADQTARAATVSAPQTIYSGSAGIVLFLLELAKATGDHTYLDDARRGADQLAATWRGTLVFPGLLSYENANLTFGMGLAGTAFTLTHAWLATGEQRYREAASAINRANMDAARPHRSGVSRDRLHDRRCRRRQRVAIPVPGGTRSVRGDPVPR